MHIKVYLQQLAAHFKRRRQNVALLSTTQLVTELVGSLHARDWADEPDPNVALASRAARSRELGQRGPAAVPTLLPALSDRDWAVRDDIVGVLEAIKHPTAVPALIWLLQMAESPAVRAHAARALSRIGTREAQEALRNVPHQ
jgi:hypothetical protein